MQKDTFGQRLQAARKRAGYRTQDALGDVVGVSGRTVRNYENDKTMPDLATLTRLRELLGEFDVEGDPVESAVRQSRLIEWRQNAVITEYQKHLYEQAREEAS